MTETTSLGGPRGSQSSASSNGVEAGAAAEGTETPDDAPSSGSWSPPAYDSMDAGRPGAFPCSYSWLPVPTSEACQYELPPGRPHESPDRDPATWDPRNVRVDVWGTDPAVLNAIGGYKAAFEDCGAGHGWYYPPTSGATPTTYMLCPASCATVSDGGDFRLMAFGWCGP
ncbi:MAG: hypothetical protein KF894_26775 [Labilithrix sp.]|nr:hypothetical protein [Labilithrix sp.]